MILTIKYFGMLAEVTECAEETITFSESTVSELLKMLLAKYPALEKKEFQVAQNQTLVSEDAQILNSEIVLLPPFAGG
ncbi:MoaD/ThiS family protein [Psychroserpens luteolus]|uniref:MoaD/ThiS family protein n=1 Tax=Psychroserpens luteolus TaxID=2855840 RepID=UPI001E327F05|nr:MoaD/ThiS family protein [Psychroserpens luteolus]MCD2257738.1 MoaD/ThiS family protein [Psychroserpens luteolus]